MCWVYQDALVAQKLLPSQKHIGEACRFFLKALTNHATDDLVDRATGFEDVRKRRAIDKTIQKYVEVDARAWVQMFDLDFYRHIFRLNGWPFDPEKTARPGVIGKWTNVIYDRLAPGVVWVLIHVAGHLPDSCRAQSASGCSPERPHRLFHSG